MSQVLAAKVGEADLTLESAFEHARARGDVDFVRQAARSLLIQRSAIKLGVKVTEDELQRGADAFRQSRGLYTAEATEAWLRANGTTVYDLERVASDVVLEAKLRRALTDADVEDHFDAHRSDYDRAGCVTLVVPDQDQAADIRARLDAEGFHAVRHEVASGDGSGAFTHTVEGWRVGFPADLRDAVFGAEAGTIIGPLRTDDGWSIALVEYIHPAVLTPDVVAAIQDDLFEAWLGEEEQHISYPAFERGG